MQNLVLVKPNEEYIDEIRAYRQEFLEADGHINGASGLDKFTDPHVWIAQSG